MSNGRITIHELDIPLSPAILGMDEIVTSISTPGSDTNLVTESAVQSVIDSHIHLLVPQYATHPDPAAEGMLYYNSTDNTIYGYGSGAWRDILDWDDRYPLKTNVLEKDNTTLYVPSAIYHPATKDYVDTEVATAVSGTETKMVRYLDRYTMPADGTTATIDIMQYVPADNILLVYKNSTYIHEGEEYSVTNNTTITKSTGTWNSGDVFDFIVYKQVANAAPEDDIDPTRIIQDATHRFVSDTQILQWDGYVHTQVATATTWNINHNLDKAVNVIVYNSSNQKMHGLIEVADSNTISVTFTEALTGVAYVS